jgi:hypothetical protein
MTAGRGLGLDQNRAFDGAMAHKWAAALRDRAKLAREEARMLCDELMAEDAIALIRHDLIAA